MSDDGHRHRRQTANGQDVFIDAIAIVAFDVYSRFYNKSEKTTPPEKEADALTKIKTHFALLMAEADRFYLRIGNRLPFTISLKLAGFIIAQTADASPWTETIKEPGQSTRHLVFSPDLLNNLKEWVRNSTTLTAMDYYILFTEYDLYTNTSGTSNLGRATLQGVCASAQTSTASPGSNVAVVESLDFSRAAIITAHELGHGLGARHDGDENSCLERDSYVMASTTASVTSPNYGVFSDCSLQYFNSTLSALASAPQSDACIHTKVTPSAVPDVSALVPGQLYDIQEQCRLAFGNESFVCVKLTNLGDLMCSQTFYSRPDNPDACRSINLNRGTTCGNRKWCVEDTCESSASAPSLDESCPFGDNRATIYTGSNSTCGDYVRDLPGRCYDAYFGQQCCKTCAEIRGTTPGCEYGNRKKGCVTSQCSFLNSTGLRDCCETCASPSTTATTSTSTSTSTTKSTTSTTSSTTSTTSTSTTTSSTSSASTSSSTITGSSSNPSRSTDVASGLTQAAPAGATTSRTELTTRSSSMPVYRATGTLVFTSVLLLWFDFGRVV